MNETKQYIVVYKLPKPPGLGHFQVQAQHKADALEKFYDSNTKHAGVIKVII